MRIHRAAVLLLLAIAIPVSAADKRPAAIDAYVAALASVEQSRATVSMEPLLSAAEQAQDALMALQPDGDLAWQETLGDAEFEKLKTELRGLRLSRGYDVYAQPDGGFLLQLAQAHGQAQDREFFGLYQRFWSAELLPQYLSMGKGTTPCVRFGEGIVPELYDGWTAFARKYPRAYAGFTKQTVRDLEEAVELGTCACGDVSSVQAELGGFLKQFPKTPAAPLIRKRLVELNEDPDVRPVQCR